MIHKLLTKFKSKAFIWFSIVGFLWIIFHFFLRFIVERFPHKISLQIPGSSIFIAIVLLCIQISILYLSMLKIINATPRENMFIVYIRNFVDLFYWTPLKEFHRNVIVKVPYYGEICEDLSNQYMLKCSTEMRTWLTIYFFNFIPRIIVALTFFIDVVVYKQFAYLYILLVLIAFPLIFDSIIYMFYDFAYKNITSLERDVIVISTEQKDSIKVEFVNKHTGEYITAEENHKALEFYSKYWFLFYEFLYFFAYIKELKSRHLTYILIFTSTLYILGWSYYLKLTMTKKLVYDFMYVLITIYLNIEEPFSGLLV